MTAQPQTMPQPSDAHIMVAQQDEINFLNSNKIMMRAAMREMQVEFEGGMNELSRRISTLLSLDFKDEDTKAKAQTIATGQDRNEQPAEQPGGEPTPASS